MEAHDLAATVEDAAVAGEPAPQGERLDVTERRDAVAGRGGQFVRGWQMPQNLMSIRTSRGPSWSEDAARDVASS